MKNTYYGNKHSINTKGRNDLVIHNGKSNQRSVAVIMETKRQTNVAEMVKLDSLNTKAMHELILYYLRERITENNFELKQIIATNLDEWFIFDANVFEKHLAQDKKLVEQFKKFENGELIGFEDEYERLKPMVLNSGIAELTILLYPMYSILAAFIAK